MNVPQLRFSGFDGEWKKTSMAQATSKIGDGIHATPKYSEVGKISFINGNNLQNEKIVVNENTKKIDEMEFKKHNIYLNPTSILYSINGTIGNLAFYNHEKVLLGKSAAYLNIDIKDYNKYFVSLILRSNKVKKHFLGELTGTTIRNLSLKTIRETNFYSPTLLEQEKIADFFTLLNQKIEKQQEKVEKLEQIKKGMMQKVFSQELRFKDEEGGEFGEWNSLQFGDVVEKLIGGGTPSRSEEEYYGGSIPWVTVKDLKTNKYVADAIEYITELGLENSSSKIVDSGDLIIPTRMAVGRVLIAREEVAINQDLKGCKLKSGYDTEFIYYLYFSKSAKIAKLGSGSTVTGINIEQLMKIKIQVPVLEEQKKIADYLGSIDKKIDKEKEKLMVLEEEKRGFMQGMFA